MMVNPQCILEFKLFPPKWKNFDFVFFFTFVLFCVLFCLFVSFCFLFLFHFVLFLFCFPLFFACIFDYISLYCPFSIFQQKQQEESLQKAAERPIGDGVQSKLLRDKLAELENEIERFRKENAMLAKLRDEREKVRNVAPTIE